MHYAGGLIGTALDHEGLPPVTGDASLAVDLDDLLGEASFTSLAVHREARSERFAGGNLYYPFELSGNAIQGTRSGSVLRPDFYGPGHEEIAGTLRDALRSTRELGATVDERALREEVVADASYIAGRAYTRSHPTGLEGPAKDAWTEYQCSPSSSCESRHNFAQIRRYYDERRQSECPCHQRQLKLFADDETF